MNKLIHEIKLELSKKESRPNKIVFCPEMIKRFSAIIQTEEIIAKVTGKVGVSNTLHYGQITINSVSGFIFVKLGNDFLMNSYIPVNKRICVKTRNSNTFVLSTNIWAFLSENVKLQQDGILKCMEISYGEANSSQLNKSAAFFIPYEQNAFTEENVNIIDLDSHERKYIELAEARKAIELNG